MANMGDAGLWRRLTLTRRAWPGLMGGLAAAAGLFAAGLILIGGGLIAPGASGAVIAAAGSIPGLPDALPYRPPADVRVRALSDWRLKAPDPVQISHEFSRGAGASEAMTLLAPSVQGEAALFVNGVPTGAAAASTPYLALTGARPVIWAIPPHFLRPGLNRLDIIVTGSRHRSLMAPLLLAAPGRIASLHGAITGLTEGIRRWLAPLAVLAAALALAAAVLLRTGTPWVALAAAAAATGVRGLASEPLLLPWLGAYAPTVDMLALGAALICLGCAFGSPRTARSPLIRGLIGAGSALLVLLLCLSLFGGHQGRADLQAAGLGLPGLGLIFLAWTSASALQAGFSGSVTARVLEGVVLGTLAMTTASAVAAATGLVWGLWVLGLEAAYGLGGLSLLGGLAVLAAIRSAQAVWRWAQDRPRLSRIILSQQLEIAAGAQALQQQAKRSAVLEERQRLSRDMHDGIGGQLMSLLARVRSRGITAEQLEGELTSGLAELRLMVDSLDASDGPVADALAVLRSRIRTQTEAAGMTLEWSQSEALNAVVADPARILNLNRLIQEVVTNAIRHSGGALISVSLSLTQGSRLIVSIRDDGTGFDLDQIRPGRGLSNLAYRAAQMGGVIRFDRGEAGRGTWVEAVVIAPQSPPG